MPGSCIGFSITYVGKGVVVGTEVGVFIMVVVRFGNEVAVRVGVRVELSRVEVGVNDLVGCCVTANIDKGVGT
jgi:hypothetical protein